MCEFHDSNDNGFGDIWRTDKLIYFSNIDIHLYYYEQRNNKFEEKTDQ